MSRPQPVAGRARVLGLVPALAASVVALGCKVDQGAFENRIFGCDPSAKDPGCGVDSQGSPMICYPGSILDGTDFCTAACEDPGTSAPGQHAPVCVQGNALLRYCDPSAAVDDPNGCGTSQLGCLRTDVTSEEGVCTTMTPCTADSDCTDPVRTTCAGTFLKQLYANNTNLETDHLYCLQRDCASSGSSCLPGQSCLPLEVPPEAHAPDICVPNCDSQGRCPPNHFCYRTNSGPANPDICIPGLAGFVCQDDIDCLVGKCVGDGDASNGQGLHFCTVFCNSDTDCTPFDSDQGLFVCVPPAPGADAGVAGDHPPGRCVTPNAYRGASCFTDADCTRDQGTLCVYSEPPTKPTDQGSCLRPCAADGSCVPHGGIDLTCLPFFTAAGSAVPACFPGFFGYPCGSDANCVGGLTCRLIPEVTPNRCTTLCQVDADCNGNRWTGGAAYCAGSVCAPLLPIGSECMTSSQCQSKLCQSSSDSSGAMTCQATP